MDKPVVTTSWDDGHPLDLKLAELLEKYDIPATFYIPINYPERDCMGANEIKEIAESFDIGGHTYNHLNLPQVSIEEAEREVADCKKKLEEMTGKEIVSFGYPYGSFNDEITKVVEEAGFSGARTVKLFTRNIKDPFKMGTMMEAIDYGTYVRHIIKSKDFKLLGFMLRKNLANKGWDEVAIGTLDFVIENGGIWHLWGHSWEIDAAKDWTRLERVFKKIGMLSKEVQRVNNSQLIRMHRNKISH